MKSCELIKQTDAELEKELLSLLKSKASIRMRMAVRQFNNYSQYRSISKDIARVLTILRSRRLDK